MKIKEDEHFAEEFQHEINDNDSGAEILELEPPCETPYASLPSTSGSTSKVDEVDDRDLARDSASGPKKLEHAPPSEPIPSTGLGKVYLLERPPDVAARDNDVAPGAFLVVPSSRNTATSQTIRSPMSSNDSTRELTNETESGLCTVEAQLVTNETESGLYAVEAQLVTDGNEQRTTILAEAKSVALKWHQRPLFRWILASGLVGAVVVIVVLVVRPGQPVSSAPSNSTQPSDSTQLGNTKESFARDVLPESTRYELQNSSSFQTVAMEWMWADPVVTGALPSFRRVQRFALATMALSLTSDYGNFGIQDAQAIGWLTDAHECTWRTSLALSLVCNAQGRYQYLDASGFGFAGTIPVELSLLTDLTHINLSYNKIRGSIPTQIGLVPLLEQFTIANASLTGSIPTEFGLLTALIKVDVTYNEISGTIPSELGLLTKLSRFFLDGNVIFGTLPSQFGQLVELRAISVRGNSISGTLPTEVGLWEFVYGLAFSDNALTGTLPTELGQLSSLELLDLRGNNWTGPIPSEMGLLSMLDVAVLHDSSLMGSVPWQVCALFNRTLDVFTIDCSQVTTPCNCTCSDALVDGFLQKFSEQVSQVLQIVDYKATP